MRNPHNHTSLIFERTGQVVSFYPPDAELIAEGAPTSAATYSVWRGTQSNNDTAMLTGTATLDAVATTVATTAAGYSQANRRTVTCASTASVVLGDRYLLANGATTVQREVVVPMGNASPILTLEEDLSFDYAITTSTLKGLRHYFTIDATFIADSSNINVWGSYPTVVLPNIPAEPAPPFRVRWVYATGSTTRESWTAFDVVRHPAKANLSVVDLRSVCPDITAWESKDQRGQDWQPQLVRAEQDVALDLRGDGTPGQELNDPQFYDRLVLWRWWQGIGLDLWIRTGKMPDWYNEAKDGYQQLRAKYVAAGARAWVDKGTAGSTTSRGSGQLWFR